MTAQVRHLDILCLCNRHSIGGATLNAGMLAWEFEKRGLNSALGFLYEREPDSHHGDVETFILGDRLPRTPIEIINYLRRYRSEVLARRPRVIIGFQPAANIIGGLTTLLLRDCVMVATQRNPASEQSWLGRALDKVLGCTSLYRCNIAVSESVARSFRHYPVAYTKKIRVVHNGAPKLPVVTEQKEHCREILGIHASQRAIGCVGRLHPQKNFSFALRVHSELPEDIHFYIAGSGADEAQLRQLAADLGTADRVHFLGNLQAEGVARFYKALDVLLFPSLYEGFGRVLVESFSQGTPVISNDIEVAREVADNAAVFCPLDIPQWKEAILRILSDRDYRDQLICTGHLRAKEFDVETMVSGYLKLAGFN